SSRYALIETRSMSSNVTRVQQDPVYPQKIGPTEGRPLSFHSHPCSSGHDWLDSLPARNRPAKLPQLPDPCSRRYAANFLVPRHPPGASRGEEQFRPVRTPCFQNVNERTPYHHRPDLPARIASRLVFADGVSELA